MFEGTGMDTSYGQGGGGFVATQDTVERKNVSARRNQAWIPVLTSDVRDLLPGQEAIRRGTFESSEVTMVGIIRSSDRKYGSSNIDYYIDDNTGPPLLVNQFIEEERDGNMIPIADNTYVRVCGKVRTWGNQRGITAFGIIPIKNLNELTMHMLEVAHCKLFFSKDILRRHEERAMNKTAGGGGAGAMANTGGATAGTRTAANMSSSVSSGLSGLNGEIHKFLNSATSESGYSVQDIQRRFPQMNVAKIREQLELLSSEGHVYTTIDDDHYKTTDN